MLTIPLVALLALAQPAPQAAAPRAVAPAPAVPAPAWATATSPTSSPTTTSTGDSDAAGPSLLSPSPRPQRGEGVGGGVGAPGIGATLLPPGTPLLRWGIPTRCIEAGGAQFRAQCDPASRRCLLAPDAELGPDGEPRAPVDRAPACEGPAVPEGDLRAQGFTLEPAIAEVPPGWHRDERQRAMQVNFDLDRRLWVGAGYVAGGASWANQGVVDVGIRADLPFWWWGAPALARFRLLEGWTTVDGARGEIVAAVVDASRAYPSPFIRITTFVGKPRRFDPPLYVGGWAEVFRFETIKLRTGKRFDRTEAAAAAITLDLWRSRDLESFVRLRGGAGYEEQNGRDSGDWTPGGAAEADLTIDAAGLHHLRAAAKAEAVLAAGDEKPPALTPGARRRYSVGAEYEVVVLAVNDQPLSIVLAARAARRDDVPDYPTGWLGEASASLRFSLWAPARRSASSQDRL